MVNKILIIIFLVNLFSFHYQVLAEVQTVIAERESIRIAAFYYLENASPQEKKTISEQLVPAAISYYQATLKVTRLKKPIVLSKEALQDCGIVETQQSVEERIEADLVLLVTGYHNFTNGLNKSNAIAFARNCLYDLKTSRATIGSVYFNLGRGLNTTNSVDTIYEHLLLTTMHEIGHILGFKKEVYDFFRNPWTGERLLNTTMKKEVNGMMVTVLTLDPLTQRLRDYFACPTLEGAYLEQQGGEGSINSHFERRIFMNEFITAANSMDARVSEFFLALLEGTGWYTPNYEMSEPMYWGKGKGCEFLNTKCLGPVAKSNFNDHFCRDFGKQTCSYDRVAYGYCGSSTFFKVDSLESAFDYWGDGTVVTPDSYSDNCPYNTPTETVCGNSQSRPAGASKKEYFGPQSACFTGNLRGERKDLPFCFKQSCHKIEPDQYVVNIEIGSQTIVCHKEGRLRLDGRLPSWQEILFGDGEAYINCPDPVSFCILVTPYFCRRGCMGRGTCVNNQCVCNKGYFGSDCSYRNVNMTQAEGLPIEYIVAEELPKKSISDEELPRKSKNYHSLILPFFLFIIVLILWRIIRRRMIRKENGINQERNDISPQKIADSSRLEMPNIKLLNNDWNQHGIDDGQIAEQDASAAFPYVKIGNQEG